MIDWLKTDPESGWVIGPDGAHYANKKQMAHFAVLGLCGCGRPEESYNFMRRVLFAFEPLKDRPWPLDTITELVKDRPDIAAEVLAHMLSHMKLIEHGGSVGGSWLLPDGMQIVGMGDMSEEEMDQDEVQQ